MPTVPSQTWLDFGWLTKRMARGHDDHWNSIANAADECLPAAFCEVFRALGAGILRASLIDRRRTGKWH